ncbi:MAG: hypothetical protein NTW17_00120 [Candidatus Pacearchaeota archaeon]|nr:hypothetical protein [Candidatus Pacearchaeota archaeon]
MSLKEYALAGTLIGALAYGATEAQAQRRPQNRVTAAQPVAVESTQARTRNLQNRILSGNYCLSATGEGIYLKNFCHDVELGSDSRINLNQRFSLSATVGNDNYEVITGREGVRYGLRMLRRGRLTPEKRASITYLENLLQRMSENDSASVSLLEQDAQNGILGDGINDLSQIHEGIYAFVAKSGRSGRYVENGMPIFVNIRIPGRETRAQEQAQRDTAAAHEGERAQRVVAPTDTGDANYRRGRAPVRANAEAARTLAPQRTGQEFVPPRTARRVFGAGLEAAIGTDNELILGMFANARIIPGIGLELSGRYFSRRGDSDFIRSPTDTTERATEHIGSTYKTRTDEITTSFDEKGFVELGGRILIEPAGVKIFDRTEDIEGRSTIESIRNGNQLEAPQVITNSQRKSRNVTHPSLTAELRVHPFKNFFVSAGYNRTIGRGYNPNQQNRGTFGVGFDF